MPSLQVATHTGDATATATGFRPTVAVWLKHSKLKETQTRTKGGGGHKESLHASPLGPDHKSLGYGNLQGQKKRQEAPRGAPHWKERLGGHALLHVDST